LTKLFDGLIVQVCWASSIKKIRHLTILLVLKMVVKIFFCNHFFKTRNRWICSINVNFGKY